MSRAVLWDATDETGGASFFSIPGSCVDSILKDCFKTVFFFDISHDILVCHHMNEPRMSEFSNVRMLLPDALDYWLSHIVEPEDRSAVRDFFARNVLEGGAGNATVDFRAYIKSGERKYYRGYLYDLKEGRFLFCCRDISEQKEARAQFEWQQEKYRIICQESDIITFDYNVAKDEVIYSFNLPPDGYQERTVPGFLANIETSTLFREAQLQAFKDRIGAALNGERVEEFEILLNLHHHGFEWYSTRLYGIRDNSDRVCRVIGRTQSIQAAKDRQMKRLRSEAVIQIALSAEALFSAAFSLSTGEKVSITGEVIPERFKNVRTLSQVFAYLQENVHPEDVEVLLSSMLGSYVLPPEETARKRKFECRLRSAQRKGSYRWVQITYMHTFHEMADSVVLYIFVMDIDEEKRRVLQIVEQANIDPTTKFLNRTAFERLCRRERADPHSPLAEGINALVVLEFHLEEQPPGYGSIQCLEAMARELAEVIRLWERKEDIIARCSDTKFLVCMHALENQVILRERVESLRRALNHFEQKRPGASVYLGVTRCRHEEDSGFTGVYDQAEQALYAARKQGGQEAVFYSDALQRRTGSPARGAVRIRTFGYFDVFIGPRPIVFRSAKAKELLAVLVDRQGGLISTDEAISYLWEDEPADKVTRSRYRKVAMRLKETLEDYGIGDIVEVTDHRRRIVTEKVQCDLYDYLSGKSEFSNLYSGSYLLNYSWAEVTVSQLNRECCLP